MVPNERTVFKRAWSARLCVTAVTLVALASATPTFAAGPRRLTQVELGHLVCQVGGGFGLVLGSARPVDCWFETKRGAIENYKGKIYKLGLDLGFLQGSYMVWFVLAPSLSPGPGDLAGHYAGATGSATVGLGVGMNVLVGGLRDSIALQPVSFEGTAGIDVAAGLATLNLSYVGQTEEAQSGGSIAQDGVAVTEDLDR